MLVEKGNKNEDKSNIEIRVFNHKTDKVAYKRLTNSEVKLLVKNIKLEWS